MNGSIFSSQIRPTLAGRDAQANKSPSRLGADGSNIKKTIDNLRQRLSISPSRALETMARASSNLNRLTNSRSGVYKGDDSKEEIRDGSDRYSQT